MAYQMSSPGASTPPDPAAQKQAQEAAAYQQVLGSLFSGTNSPAVLKSVPAALADIQNRDPAFDQTNFLARADYAYHLVRQAVVQQKPEMSRQVMADTLWLQHRDAIIAAQRGGPAVPQLPAATSVITAAHTDASYDTIVVRFSPTGGGQVQDWSFQRSASAVTKAGAAAVPDRCPSCGAPLQLDESGVCSYCKAVVSSGQYDWVLVRTEPVANPYTAWSTMVNPQGGLGMTNVSNMNIEAASVAGGSRMVRNIIILVVILAVVLPLAIAVPAILGAFKSTSGVSSSVPQSGNGTRYAGSLVLTGAITAPALNLSGTSNSHPNCKSLASDDTGSTTSYTTSSGADQYKLEMDLSHPQGPGTYDQSKTTITIIETPLNGTGPAQTWKAGSGSTASFTLTADDNHTLTFANLQPQNPAALDPTPLSGKYTESCTNR